jgi:hypothetical protein
VISLAGNELCFIQWFHSKVYLTIKVGNILSAWFWIFSKQFGYFVLARVIGGLSEGNVQISVAMITDITTKETRSKGLVSFTALVKILRLLLG